MDPSYFDKELTHYEIKPVREMFTSIGGKLIGRMIIVDHIPEKLPLEVFYPLPRVLRSKILNCILQSENDLEGWTLTMRETKIDKLIHTFHVFPRYYKIADKSNDPVIRAIAKEMEFDKLHPPKRVSEETKRMVWNKHIGEMENAKCTCCQRMEMNRETFQCGSVIPELHGGNALWSNLRPICQNCSSSMGKQSMEEFMSTFL